MNYQIAKGGTGREGRNGFHGANLNRAVGLPDGPGGEPTNPPPGWHHYAFTFDDCCARMYEDGALVDSVCAPGDGFVDEDSLFFGTSGTCSFMTGYLDEVRIWSVARSSAEIASSWSCRVDPSSPCLVGYWSFDEDMDDQRIVDLSPQMNHGWLGNSPTVEPVLDPVRSEATVAPLGCNVSTACGEEPCDPTSTRQQSWGIVKRMLSTGSGAAH